MLCGISINCGDPVATKYINNINKLHFSRKYIMTDNIFRKYDIRGKVGSELSIEGIYDLASAIAYYFVQKNPGMKTVVVGMDGRNHSPDIKDKVCKALMDSGLNVIFIGTCASPVLYFALFKIPVDAGLMITASHNSKEYNGIKICLGKDMVWGDEIQKIKKLFIDGKHIVADQKGKYSKENMIKPYVDWMRENFKNLIGMKLSAVIDCGNGAAGTVLPLLVKKMEWKNVTLLFDQVDGNYPNHEADPVVEENMLYVKNVLAESDIEVGIGLDGDCDRMAPMTKSGELVSGDKLLAVYAKPILEENSGACVVFDVKSSSGLIEFLKKFGGVPFMSPTGHAIIKTYMKKNNALLAGELSCHFFFADRYFGYDDGIYAMLRLFEIILNSGKSLQELISVFPKKFSSPEMRIECPDNKKKKVVEHAKKIFEKRDDVELITIDGIRVVMNYGWGILRVSNTQPAVSLRFESDSIEGLHKVRDDFFDAMKVDFDEDYLKKEMKRVGI